MLLIVSYLCPKSLQLCLALETPKTVAHQAPLSMAFSRQEYWGGFDSGDLTDPRIEPMSLMSPALAGGSFTTSATWEVLLIECVLCSVAQSCLILCNPMDYLKARILEWVAFPSSRASSQPRDGTQVSHIAGKFFTS